VSSSRAGGAKLHRAQLRQLAENVTTSSEYWMAVNYHTTSTPKTLAESLFVMLKKIFVYPSVLLLSVILIFPAGGEEVTLAWDSNTEPSLAGYRLYYGLGANYSSLIEVGAASTMATVSNLQANQTYVFAVTAFDANGLESPFSEQVSYMVPARIALNRPPIVNAGADKSVNLPAPVSLAGSVTDDGLPNPPGTWTASWRVISGPGTVVFSAPASVTSSATFFQAGQYVLRLTANDGALSASDDVQVNVLNGNQTGPVVSQLAVIAADSRTITLGWQTDKPALCTVEYGLTSSFGLVAAETTLVASHLVTLSNLQPATNYVFRIRSADAVTNVSFTDTMMVRTPAVTVLAWAAEAGVLVAPMSIGSDATALDGLYVSSTTSAGGIASFPVQLPVTSQYRAWCRIQTPAGDGAPFYVSMDGTGERLFATPAGEWKSGWRWAAVKTNTLVGPALWLFNLNTDIHQFVFRANDSQTLFDELILSNDPNWTPGIDANRPVLSTAGTPVNRIDLTWTDATSNEEGFVVERSMDGAQFTAVASLPAGTTTYQDGGLALSTSYYYRIYAFNESDRTEYSNVSAAQTGATEQSSMAPGNVTATTSGGTIRVGWVDNSADETGFIVERSTDGINFVTAQTVGANTTQVTDAPPRKRRYYYRVRSFNAFGTSVPSNTVTVRLR
jgi:hypothetical protein